MRSAFGKVLKSLVCLILVISMPGFFCSCGNSKKNDDLGDYQKYLGDYYYDCSISAMVFETPEGEEFPGVLYRQVTDLDSLVKTCPIPICFLFYSGMHADIYGLFASVEEMVEQNHDKVLVVAIDGLAEKELSSAYKVEAMPEAIIIKNGAQVARFDGKARGEWTAQDLVGWVLGNVKA